MALISDRADPGGPSSIYLLSVDHGQVHAIGHHTSEAKVSAIKWSPDGRYIAFLSPETTTRKQQGKKNPNDDAIVYHRDWECDKLHVVHTCDQQLFNISMRMGMSWTQLLSPTSLSAPQIATRCTIMEPNFSTSRFRVGMFFPCASSQDHCRI